MAKYKPGFIRHREYWRTDSKRDRKREAEREEKRERRQVRERERERYKRVGDTDKEGE